MKEQSTIITFKLERYSPKALPEILRLFYDTVHTVNSRDYSPAQLDAWAPSEPELSRWEESLAAHCSLLARAGERLVGFGDIDLKTGYLDRLYVQWDCLHCGIATALADALESRAIERGETDRLTTEASITAKPFFINRGYRVVREQQKRLRGQVFCNYLMEKQLNAGR